MITPVKLEDIPRGKKGPDGTAAKEIEAFIASGNTAGEIDIPPKARIDAVRLKYAIAAKNAKLPVKLMQRDKRLFIIREG